LLFITQTHQNNTRERGKDSGKINPTQFMKAVSVACAKKIIV